MIDLVCEGWLIMFELIMT